MTGVRNRIRAVAAGALVVGVVGALVAGPVAGVRGEGGGESLPTDPGVLMGSLASGMRYVIKPHGGTPGRVAMRLIVRAGSLMEPEETPGVAAIAGRLLDAAANESPAGRAWMELAREAGGNGRVQTFTAGFESARFTIETAGDDSAAVKGAMWRLAEVARGAGLSEERAVALRAGALEAGGECGLDVRLTRAVAPRLAPGSKLGRHLPCPADEHVCAIGEREIVEFVRDRYTPERMTLVVVGDIPAEVVRNYAVRLFGDIPRARGGGGAAAGDEPGAGAAAALVGGGVGPRVLAVGDAELPGLVVELMVAAPSTGPMRTESDLRARLVDTLAMKVLQQRLRGLIDRGEAAFRSAEAWTGEAPGPMRLTTATVSGEARQMRRVIERLCREVAHARYEGASEQRLFEARAETLAELEEAARNEGEALVGVVLERVSRAVERGGALSSPGQHRAVVERLLGSITASEVGAALGERLDLDRCVVVALTPGEGGDSVAEALRPMVEESLASVPVAAEEEAAPASLLSRAPTAPAGGGVARITIHPEGGVASLWLTNGVRGHIREMSDRPGMVAISVTLAGGRIEETEAQRGLTFAGAALWRNPASASRSASQVRRIMLGQNVKLAASVGADSVRLTVLCSHESAEPAMRLLHLLLSEPLVEAPGLSRWRWGMLREIEGRGSGSDAEEAGRIGDGGEGVRMGAGGLAALAGALDAGEESGRPGLDADEVRAIQRSSVQEWMEGFVRRAPLECAIAGDIDRTEAMELLTRYLGTLEPRDRVSERTFCELRRATARPLPGVHRLMARGEGSESLSFVAMRGAGPGEGRAGVLLDLGARILSARLERLTGVEGVGKVGGVVARHAASRTHEDDGLFYALGSSAAEDAERLVSLMNREMSALATEGPGEEELGEARAAALAEWEFRGRDPSYWALALGELTYRGGSVEEILSRPALIARASPGEIARALAERDGARGPDGERLTIIVTPGPPGRPLDNLAATRGR